MSEPAEFVVTETKRSFWRNLSPVWLVPLLAVLVSLGLAWQAYQDRGVAIEISFPNAAGVSAGTTTLRYRDVEIGVVEDVGFSVDLTRVQVTARVDKSIAPFLDQDAMFWVVRPEVSSQGISGLDTVLSGVYIEGDWDTEAGTARTIFEGLDRAPLTRPGREGTRITLRADDARSVSAGAPVLYRGIQVGVLEDPRLTLTGREIVVDAFIDAPHDQRLSTATRFWDASGFSVSIGAGGLSLDVDSLASLVVGGLAFDAIYEGGQPLEEGYVFEIYPDEDTARRTAFTRTIADPVMVGVAFSESVDGLSPGAAVRYGGLRVGEVSSLAAEIIETNGGPEVRLVATLAIDAALLGLPEGSQEEESLDFFEDAVANGLRVQLATENLFSGALVVDLVNLPEQRAAVFDRTVELPMLPSVESDLPDFTATAEGVLERLNELPIEELMEQAVLTLRSFETLAANEALNETPEAALALLEETRGLVAQDAIQALPAEAQSVLTDLQALIDDLRQVGLASAVTEAERAAASLAAAADEVPALLADLRALAVTVGDLPTEALVEQAVSTLESIEAITANAALQDTPEAALALLQEARGLVAQDATQALPEEIQSSLAEVRALVEDLRQSQALERLTSALVQADQAAGNIATASEEVPALVADLRTLAATANGLPAEELIASATEFLASARAMIGAEDMRDLPGALNAALAEAQAALEELNAGDLVANANATLASTRDAATAIANATESLPQLSARLDALVSDAQALVSVYDGRSDFNEETLRALRDFQDAANAVSQLSRAIERNPNSIILGR